MQIASEGELRLRAYVLKGVEFAAVLVELVVEVFGDQICRAIRELFGTVGLS